MKNMSSGVDSKSFDNCSKSSKRTLLFGINEILADKEPSRHRLPPDDKIETRHETRHSNLEAYHNQKAFAQLDDSDSTESFSPNEVKKREECDLTYHLNSEKKKNNEDTKPHSHGLYPEFTQTHEILARLIHEGRIPGDSFLQTFLAHQVARTLTQEALPAGAPMAPSALVPCTASATWINERKEGLQVLTRRVGHPYQTRNPPRSKKPRTSFSRVQLVELEKRFHRQKYLASAERTSLAKMLKMTDAQVKTWFQNRRTKWRRQTAEEREAERQVTNRLMLSIGAPTDGKSSCFCYPSHVLPDLSGSSLAALRGLHP